MRKTITVSALAAASLALGGCQAVLGTLGLAARPSHVETAALDMSDYFQSLIESGKAQLRAGLASQAIVSFRQASYDRAHAGEAYNGLGVAYASLGRDDLAERYFTLAMSADPGDARFARNLARLEQATGEALAQAAATQSALPALTAAPAAAVSAPNQAPAEATLAALETAPAGRPAEVFVSSRGTTVAVANPPALGQSPGPRILAAGLRPSRGATPVRVAANDIQRPLRPAYPVRIDLTAMH